ncbi:hypothetical protein BDP27DRAFT_309712 [Rhodocollybia butyracea]|uniref:Uncharacterized protein n=1 Tax=Rhodocollybia butyracea TaxID=206335 RepID=A0A9P5PEP0_9AGAR|nr:hypothetical protein BDP27DRAFT_309712 [Rhodocollybia butyracea]
MYMIFGRNIIVEDDFDRLPGKLCVVSLEPDDVTSVVSLVGESGNEAPRNVPPFFYVVEEHCDASNLHINAIGEANQILDNISGWVKGSEESANITLMKQRDNVRFMWNGLSTDRKLRRRNWDATIDSGASLASLQRHVRRAARFNRYLAAPSPLNSPVLEKLRFLLHKIDTDKEKWARTGENMLEGRYSVDLTLSEKEKIKGPYCLTICNDNGFAVWPYVFMCDPKASLFFLDDLLFQYRKNQDYDVLYLKIFVTKEKTDFSFIRQWFAAKNEEKLRDYSSSTVHSHDHRLEAQSHIDSTFTEESSPIKTKPKIAGWASVCATILVTYETKGKGESKLEVLGVDEEARSSQDTASVNKDGKEKEGSTLEEAYVTQEVNDSNQSSAPQQKDHKTKKRESGIQKLWSKLANR